MSKLVNCKACGKVVATSANTCPGCGVNNPGIHAKNIFVLVVLVVIISFAVVFFTSSDKIDSDGQSNHDNTAQTLATIQSEMKDLTVNETISAFSDYVGALQIRIVKMGVMNAFYLSKIKQDIKWGNLDKYREDAGSLKETAQNFQKEISEIGRPINITDQHAEQFDTVYEEASNIAMEMVSIAVDLSVNANTGMSVKDDIEKDVLALKKAKKAFNEKVTSAYNGFGVRTAQIDKETLTIKTTAIKQ